ncbi:MAG: FAD-dependent oxidoreductase, partial [Eggerthellaceae bacterium]
GVETRSSSPIRIVRNENFQAVMDQALPDGLETGIFPCGEGPGYAGGIMSAAVDGLKVAAAVLASFLEIKR